MPASKSAKPVQSASKAAAKTEKKAPAVTAPKSKAAQLKEAADALLAAAEAPAKKKAGRPAKAAADESAAPAKATTGAKRGRKPKAAAAEPSGDDMDMSDIEADLVGEPEPAAAPGEKVKPLRMKISKAKERALMKEFGLDETVLSEEDMAKRLSLIHI
jgi:RNA polymerase primary sigma factor